MTDGSGSTPDANAGGAADTSGEGYTYTNKTGNNATDGKNSSDSTSITQGRHYLKIIMFIKGKVIIPTHEILLLDQSSSY